MATLTVIIGLLGLVAFYQLMCMVNIRNEDEFNGIFIISLFIVILVTSAIHYDLHRSLDASNTIYSLNYWLEAGLVLLGLSTLSILLFRLFRGADFSHLHFSGADYVGFTLSFIGLISSILGILSFYLDYLH